MRRKLELHVEIHNVSEMMRKITADYLMFLEEQNYTVEVNIPDEDIHAWIDASLIERALRNLMDNAIRYGSEGYYLEVGLTEKEKVLFITVIDKGVGIGLSIVQEIIALHDGSIPMTSIPLKRTVFEIQLPKH